jgi:hypothetical protein
MKCFVAMALFVSLTVQPALGGHFYTGNDLAERLQRGNSTGLGYVIGIADTLQMDPIPHRHICISPDATEGQMEKVVMKYLEGHPESLDQPAAVLVSTALIAAFHCD